jgi:hypothetical protein
MTYALVILVVNLNGIPSMTSITGFTDMNTCNDEANKIVEETLNPAHFPPSHFIPRFQITGAALCVSIK